ncbi:hypothetical protein F5Y14DRAFT_459887 [Nemania sp. NC0429]|nr:hypothetical protein F5Y14DRAFT_459887 [Nemania sp. NC0429]
MSPRVKRQRSAIREPRFKRQRLTPLPSQSAEVVTIEHPGGTLAVHALLIAHHSRYFRTVLNGKPKGVGNVIKLAEATGSIDGVQLFIDWLYTRSVGKSEERNDGITSKYGYQSFIRGWIFGGHIEAPSFQNDMARYIFHNENIFNWCSDMRRLWDKVPEGSCLEELLLDMLCKHLLNLKDEEDIVCVVDDLPSVISQKVLRLILPHLQNAYTGERSMVRYDANGYDWKITSHEDYKVCEEVLGEEALDDEDDSSDFE